MSFIRLNPIVYFCSVDFPSTFRNRTGMIVEVEIKVPAFFPKYF